MAKSKTVQSLLGCDKKRKLSSSQKRRLSILEKELEYWQSEAQSVECMIEELDLQIHQLKYLPRKQTKIEKQIIENLMKHSPWNDFL